MKPGEHVRHRSRPDCGIGEIRATYNDGSCDAVFPDGEFSGIPTKTLICVEKEIHTDHILSLLRAGEYSKASNYYETNCSDWWARRAYEQAVSSAWTAEVHRKLEAELAARREAILNRVRNAFESNFLNADDLFNADPDASLVGAELYQKRKVKFVQDWALRELQQALDPEQAAAVAASAGDIQVVARAGSGKTRTLVTRALFLQKHCRVSPHELLLLAFNKKAADEIKLRLTKALDGPTPHVMTFHALAHAIVHPEQQLVVDDALSHVVQAVIDGHLRSKDRHDRIRDLMLSHFRDDWEHIVDGRFELTMDEFIAHRRALSRESLKGDYVKSFGEKVIANALFEHGIEYRYERNFKWNDFNYKPDFTIFLGKKGGVIIEYFGLKGDRDYDQQSDKKRAFWAKQPDWILLEFFPHEIVQSGVDAFVAVFIEKLRGAGIQCAKLSNEEIWELIRKRSLDSFTKTMEAFVGRCRKLNLTPTELRRMVARHRTCSEAETLFLEAGIPVYQDYVNHLAANQKEDFDGLMWRAIACVHEGQTRFRRDQGRECGDVAALRFVMIDEFQDFSRMFYELVKAVRSKCSSIQFFCVGDDWQAINAFAGSNLDYFEQFERDFQNIAKHYVRTSYRSPKKVVEIGNALMDGLGEGAIAARVDDGFVQLCKLDEFRPSTVEQSRHSGDEITPAVLRLIRRFLDRGLDVVMLSRRRGLPGYISYDASFERIPDKLVRFLEHVRSYLPEEDRGRVSISTTHGYKGLESDSVIVLDAVDRSYPLIHPSWAFTRIFGDSLGQIESEERRLFYVAMTRAKDSLALLTDMPEGSPYLDDMSRHISLACLKWSDLPPVASLNGARLDIRVFGAFHVRDQLKNLKYQYDPPSKSWRKSVAAEGFSFDVLLAQPWVNDAMRIEVYSDSGELLYQSA